MKLLIITDAWYPQTNGVVTTLDEVGTAMALKGHTVTYITPQQFKSFPCPTYPEISFSWNVWKLPSMIGEVNADYVHIATEGPLGVIARMYCSQKRIPFTSSYHTKMPEYIQLRLPLIPVSLTYRFMRWLHKPSKAILATTESMKSELISHGFQNKIVVWSRGTNYTVYHPYPRTRGLDDTKVLLYVGRVSIEKNLEAFLAIDKPNTKKIIVGDGPQRKKLEAKYPDVAFVGYKKGVELAMYMANADVFVFPSKSDTFGIVMIEAAACGTPIAAYPVTGPLDFVVNGVNGYIHDDLSLAIDKALIVDRDGCYHHTKANYTWNKCADILIDESLA